MLSHMLRVQCLEYKERPPNDYTHATEQSNPMIHSVRLQKSYHASETDTVRILVLLRRLPDSS